MIEYQVFIQMGGGGRGTGAHSYENPHNLAYLQLAVIKEFFKGWLNQNMSRKKVL